MSAPPPDLSLDEALLVERLRSVFATQTDVRVGLEQSRERILEDIIAVVSRELLIAGVSDVVDFIEHMDEPTILSGLIVPLFKQLGFERVVEDKHHHRSLEFGQDIRLLRHRLPTGHVQYYVAQLKKGAIRSSTASPRQDVEAILLQLEKALEKTVFDDDSNTAVRPDHVFLIATGSISKDARLYLEERISADKRRRVMIIDGDRLLDLCRRHGLPPDAQSEIRRAVQDRGPRPRASSST